jgi:hypothetical protein
MVARRFVSDEWFTTGGRMSGRVRNLPLHRLLLGLIRAGRRGAAHSGEVLAALGVSVRECAGVTAVTGQL